MNKEEEQLIQIANQCIEISQRIRAMETELKKIYEETKKNTKQSRLENYGIQPPKLPKELRDINIQQSKKEEKTRNKTQLKSIITKRTIGNK